METTNNKRMANEATTWMAATTRRSLSSTAPAPAVQRSLLLSSFLFLPFPLLPPLHSSTHLVGPDVILCDR